MLTLCTALLMIATPVQLRVTATDTPVVIIIEPAAKCQWVYDEPNDSWKIAAIMLPPVVAPNIFDPNNWPQPVVLSDEIKTICGNWLNPFTLTDFAEAAKNYGKE